MNLVILADLHDVRIEAFLFQLRRERCCVVLLLKRSKLDAVKVLRVALRLLLRLLFLCRNAQPPVYLRRDLAVPVIQIIAGARLVRVIPVNGHIAPVLVVYAVVLACTPYQLFDPVPAANIFDKIKKRRVCFIIHGVWVLCVACNLDRDCAVIVRRRRTAPRTIGFIDVKPDPPVVADPVV